MKLDKRMFAIYNEIPKNINLADIGCDHGYICVEYAKNNPNSIVIASDISEKSVNKAKQTAEENNLKNFSVRVGDGLSTIATGEVDAILISGMGGQEIIHILQNCEQKFKKYILSPQKNMDKVRVFLSNNDIKPIKDYKVFSNGIFYDIIVAECGKYLPNEAQILYGDMQGEDFFAFKQYETKRLKTFLIALATEKNAILRKLEALNGKN